MRFSLGYCDSVQFTVMIVLQLNVYLPALNTYFMMSNMQLPVTIVTTLSTQTALGLKSSIKGSHF